MHKRIFLLFFVLLVLFSSSVVKAEPRLLTIHNTVVDFAGNGIPLEEVPEGGTDFSGVVSYDTARFFAVTLEVVDNENGLPLIEPFNPPSIPITLSGGNYSFWNSYNVQEVHNVPMTFDLAMSDSVMYYYPYLEQDKWQASSSTGYVPTNSEGDWIHFLVSADNGLNGVEVTWQYPNVNLISSATIPNFKSTNEQLHDYVPCIEYTTTGTLANGDLKTTGIKWRFVLSDDVETAVPVSEDMYVQVRLCAPDGYNQAFFFDNEDKFTKISADEFAQGELTFDNPGDGSAWCTIVRYYFGDSPDEIYQWRFVTTGMSWLDSFGATTGTSLTIKAGLKNGKADYTYARRAGLSIFTLGAHPSIVEAKHLTDKGKITVHGGGTFNILDSDGNIHAKFDSPDQDITLPLHTNSLFGNNAVEYGYMTEGYRKAEWSYSTSAYQTRGTIVEDDTASLSGKEISWEFPEEISELNGSGTIPEYKTLEQIFDTKTGFFPYIELISDDTGAITAINYRIVQSPDISKVYSPDVACLINVGINGKNISYNFENNKSGTWEKTSDYNENYLNSGTWILNPPLITEAVTDINVGFRTYKVARNQENYDRYLTNAPDYQNPDNFVGYFWWFSDEAPLAETKPMTDAEINNISKDVIADAHVLDRREIFDESSTTEEVMNYIEDDDSELVGRFKQLYSNSEGWVITKVNLTDELYDNLNGVSADKLKVYALTDEDLAQAQTARRINNSFMLFAKPAFADTSTQTGKLLALDGSSVDTINSREFLMMSYLKAGKKSNMYLGVSTAEDTQKEEEQQQGGTDPTPDEDEKKPEEKPATDDKQTGNKEEQKTPDSTTEENSGKNPSVVSINANDVEKMKSSPALDLKGYTDSELKIDSSYSANRLDIKNNIHITKINLSGSKIKTFDAGGCSNLKEINLEGCISLDYVDLTSSDISSLSVKGCSNLKTLKADGCKSLKVLILEGCETSLTELDASGNSLLMLDLSNFGNQLKTISLSGQKRTGWTGVKKFKWTDFLETATDYSKNITITEVKNSSGSAVEYTNSNGEIEFDEIPASFKYEFDTGFAKVTSGFIASAENEKMDVSITASSTTIQNETENDNLGSSGGGCNVGFGILILSALGTLLYRKGII